MLATDGGSLRGIAQRYGLTDSAVHRHKKHLLPAVVEAHIVQEEARSLQLFDVLRKLYHDLADISDRLKRELEDEENPVGRLEKLKVLLDALDKQRRWVESASRVFALAFEREQAEREQQQATEDTAAVLEEICLRRLTPALGEDVARGVLALLLAEEE